MDPTVAPTDAPIVAAAPDGSGVAPAYAIGGGSLLLLVVAAMCALVLMRRGLSRRRLATGTPADRVAGAWLEVRDALRLAGAPAPAHLSATELAHARAVRGEAEIGQGGAAEPGHEGRDRAPAVDRRGGAPPVCRRQRGGGQRHHRTGRGRWSAGDARSWAAEPRRHATTRRPRRFVARPTPPELATLVDLVNRDAFAPDQTGDAEAAEAGSAARAYTSRLRAAQSRWRRLAWPFHPGPLRWHRAHRHDPH